MREIKFRAKDADDKWQYGSLIQGKSDKGFAVTFIAPSLPCAAEAHDLWTATMYRVKPETVGQSTGLKDKNGKEIYEGDILRVKEYKNELTESFSKDEDRFQIFTLEEAKGDLRDEYISPVFFHEGSFDISTNGKYFDMWLASLYGEMIRSYPIFEFDVIGNIYENPDMIPEKLKEEMK